LNSLSFTQQEILQRGSIYGRDFWEGGLAALDIQPRDEMIGDLEQRGFINEQSISALVGEREWSFHHALMRDVAYESILKRKRPGLHHAAGAWLEAQAREAGRLDEFAGRIGGHAELAGDTDAAADWYTRAGKRAWSQGAFVEARDFFNRTLELLPSTDQERRWHVLLKRDEVLSSLAENELRNEGISSLLELAREFDDQNRLAQAIYRQGVFLQGLGDLQNALGPLESALGLARETRDQSLEALALAMIALCQTHLGELEMGATAAGEAISLAERLEDDETLARVLNNAAVCFGGSGDIAKAVSLYERQIEVTNRLDYIAGEAVGQGNLGFYYAQMGMFEKSRDNLEEALRLNEALGARRASVYNLLNLALVHWRIGDASTAQQLLDKAYPILLAISETFGLAIRLSYLALSQEKLGGLSDATRSFEESKVALEELGLHAYARDALAGMARCALAQGLNEKALQHASELWGHLEEQGAVGMEFPISAYVTCAEVFNALGERGKSKEAVEAGYRELMTRADKIGDAEWCNRFLTNVPEHRAISEMWDRRAG
jgi:tetratricopeptide (TPR) repeat protein